MAKKRKKKVPQFLMKLPCKLVRLDPKNCFEIYDKNGVFTIAATGKCKKKLEKLMLKHPELPWGRVGILTDISVDMKPKAL